MKEIAAKLGVTVRFEKGDFKGGYCILKNNKVVVINKTFALHRKAITIARALQEIGINDIYMNPKLRNIVEEANQ